MIDRIKREGISHLDQTSIEFLASNSILVPKDSQSETQSIKTKEEWQSLLESTPFTIRLNPNLNNIKLVLTSMGEVLSKFNKSEIKNKPFFQIKYIYNEAEPNDWLKSIAKIISFFSDKVNQENINFYAECPIEYITKQVDRLLHFNRPSIIINCIVEKKLNVNTILSLTKLTENGYRPHLSFYVFENSIKHVQSELDILLSDLGTDGFTFSIIPQVNYISYEGVSTFENSHLVKNIINLLDYCHLSDKFNINQSWIYHDLKSRTINGSTPKPFPCNACAGRSIYIDQEGDFYSCHKQSLYESSNKKKNIEKALSDPSNCYFGQSEFARDTCDQCSLRFFCGGVCPYTGQQINKTEHRRQIFQIHCQIRKHTLLHLFEEATQPIDEKKKQETKYRFVSEKGKLELVPLDHKEGA